MQTLREYKKDITELNLQTIILKAKDKNGKIMFNSSDKDKLKYISKDAIVKIVKSFSENNKTIQEMLEESTKLVKQFTNQMNKYTKLDNNLLINYLIPNLLIIY
jgi:hypothetical protein